MNYDQLEIEELWYYIERSDPDAVAELVRRFEPLIMSQSKVNGIPNEDVAQEIRYLFLTAIQKISIPSQKVQP